MWTHRILEKVPHVGRVARATRWRRIHGRPRVWAHRGASALMTENTMAAFELAKAHGADAIELDVRCDASGAVVVFHDDDLLRLAGRTGSVEHLSASERATVRVEGNHRLPLLDEAIAAIAPLELNVELKTLKPGIPTGLPAAAASVIMRSGAHDRILVSSFDPVALLQFHAACPHVAIAYLHHRHQRWPLRSGWMGRWIGASALHPDAVLCNAASINAWHRDGYAINAWTVDEPAELQRLAKLGVDGVFVNDPGAAVRVFEDR
jgi:glycerophosphoryl diester phosphodiesterase